MPSYIVDIVVKTIDGRNLTFGEVAVFPIEVITPTTRVSREEIVTRAIDQLRVKIPDAEILDGVRVVPATRELPTLPRFVLV